MKTTAVRLYGADDVRLETFDLPGIKPDEILLRVETDSICMSTYKAISQGTRHKRVPNDVADNPIIVGHEFAGTIVSVGEKWRDRFTEGEKFALQPTLNYMGQPWAPGYSFPYYGGACTYCVIPGIAIERNCLMPYCGDSFFEASLAEPMSCIIGAFHSNYHTNRENYEHAIGTKPGGNLLILGGCGPMGLGAVSYALAAPNKPARVVVTEVDQARMERAAAMISPEFAEKKGISLHYINTAAMDDPAEGLLKLTDGAGYDDVFIFVPFRSVAELGDHVLANDGCMNVFAGPTDASFSAEINLYNVHYAGTRILGACGGIPIDTEEAVALMEQKVIEPAVMVTHVGGLDSYADTVCRLPQIPGGKKLIYTQISMPLTAIADFRKLGETDPLYQKLADSCDQHKGLWNAEAEQILLAWAAEKAGAAG